MSKLSLDKFLALVERSGLVESDRLGEVVSQWKRGASLTELDDAHFLAFHLVDTGLLTHWQAKKLLDGRHRGFFLGKYKLLDHLGSGGMSSVYLAQHVLMQRLVAVKVLPQNRVDDSSYLARFHLEAQCAAVLNHPNIVRAYDLDNDRRIHYLVMEYVEGRDLQALVSHNGPLDFHTAAHYTAQAASGLQHAHEAGLVHRDIKPANLLVDRQGTVKILDMGLAKYAAAKASSAIARDEHVLGTADYVAPEQTVNSSAVDHRADVYSLGCTLYFLLTGHPPFPSGSPLERITAHQRHAPPSILVDRPDAPQALLDICQRMMAKSAQDRYQTAREAQLALDDWLAGEAAAGRIRQPVAAVAGHSGSSRRSRGERSGSKINLITGSSPELDSRSPAPPSTPSPFADTDTNLDRPTEKIPSKLIAPRAETSHAEAMHAASQSHVFHAELARVGRSDMEGPVGTPLPPPIVAPPAPAPTVLAPLATAAIAPTTHLAESTSELPPEEIPIRVGRRWGQRSGGAGLLWTLVVSAMILGAALLAISALGR